MAFSVISKKLYLIDFMHLKIINHKYQVENQVGLELLIEKIYIGHENKFIIGYIMKHTWVVIDLNLIKIIFITKMRKNIKEFLCKDEENLLSCYSSYNWLSSFF